VEKDGGGLRRWTSLGSLSTHPALSGDGRLAFVAYLGGPPRIWTQSGIRGPAVAVYPTRGAPGRELSDLAWSPNGKLLAFAQTDRLGGAELHVLDPGSGKDLALTSGGHLDRCPSWSPDGKSIAFLSDRSGSFQVYTLGLDGRTLRQVTRDPAPKTCVAWSPRGDRLAYAEAAGAACRIQLKDPGEGAPVQVPYDGGEVEALGWAPDGRWLVLGIHGGEGSSLAVLGLDGTLRPLGDRAHGNQGPQWVRHLPRADSKAGTPSPSTHSADTTTVRPFPKEMLRCQPPPNSPRS
jgi:TolB protein